jgi:hypothetical protein
LIGAILAVLLGCGLRRSEVAALTFKHIQQRDGRWCIVDLVGKHGRVRTVPMPTPMSLLEIKPGQSLVGIEPTQIVRVIATVPLGGGAIQLIYRTPKGTMKERLLGIEDEHSIAVATAERLSPSVAMVPPSS